MASVKPLTYILVYRKLFPYYLRNLIFRLVTLVKNFVVKKHNLNNRSLENLEALRESGFVKLDPLNNFQIDKILTQINEMPFKEVVNDRNEVVKNVYNNEDLVKSFELLSLATNDEIIGVLSEYFGCLPKIQYLAAWRTFDNDDELSEMFFHMDHHGHKFVKLFLYLSDVKEGDGHHQFVKESHDWPKFDKILSLKDKKNVRNQVIAKRKWKGDFWMNNDSVIQSLRNKVISVTGNSGTFFMEDTSGLHRGTKITSGKPRLLFQVLYTPFDSGKDFCAIGQKTLAYDNCREASELDSEQFDDLCSLIVE